MVCFDVVVLNMLLYMPSFVHSFIRLVRLVPLDSIAVIVGIILGNATTVSE